MNISQQSKEDNLQQETTTKIDGKQFPSPVIPRLRRNTHQDFVMSAQIPHCMRGNEEKADTNVLYAITCLCIPPASRITML